ncbi:MAG: polyphosphate polymerase domain-containing protein [Flavobacteriales bacterium]|nr:polyphosphate polymerase domain-containing protein [Flavobacteriales bacterium]
MHIGLQELEDVALTDRSEKKYIIPIAWCGDISTNLSKDYSILEIKKKRQFRYDNLYFDTPQNICLQDHIRGRKNRFKVRIRSYSNSNISFLEVKSRNVYGRSQKMRIQRTSEKWDSPFTTKEQAFLAKCVPFAAELKPVLYSSYSRYTIANLEKGERITFDTNLEYKTLTGETFKPLDGLAIVELKQGETDRRSPLMSIFRNRTDRKSPLGRTIRISKYILGRLHTNKDLSARAYHESLKELTRAKRVGNSIT